MCVSGCSIEFVVDFFVSGSQQVQGQALLFPKISFGVCSAISICDAGAIAYGGGGGW